MNTQISRQIDLRNIGKGLIIGISALYGAHSATEYAITTIQQRLDRQSAYFLDQFKELHRVLEARDDAQEKRAQREMDQIRHDIYELRDHEAKRLNP